MRYSAGICFYLARRETTDPTISKGRSNHAVASKGTTRLGGQKLRCKGHHSTSRTSLAQRKKKGTTRTVSLSYQQRSSCIIHWALEFGEKAHVGPSRGQPQQPGDRPLPNPPSIPTYLVQRNTLHEERRQFWGPLAALALTQSFCQ